MKNIKIKKEEKAAVKKEVKKSKKDLAKVKFMEDRNAKRKMAGLPMAYAQEEIEAHK